MKQNQTPNLSGIQIENTISMAVQNRNYHRSTLFLILIAFFGAIGGIFTFLSMFQPIYHMPILFGCLLTEFVLCAISAAKCGKWLIIKLLSAGGYVLLFYLFRKAFCDGFIHIANSIYKIIFLTDWQRFTISGEFTEEYSTTVFLVFACFPIICMICYSVIHFQNLFLSLLATFPYVEIGFYQGVAPNHTYAIMLFAFWASMCAVHLSNSGAYHKKEQNSFLRRDNTFFPVSSMRFMVTEKIGVIVLCVVMILGTGIDLILQATNYHRNDFIKKIRSDTIENFSSMDFSNLEDRFSFLGMNRPTNNNRVVVKLGRQDKQEYQNISISGLTFSELPEGRIYLKFLTGEIYDENTWSMLPLEEYESNDVFKLFEKLDYYPQDFLYENVILSSSSTTTMTMHNLNRVISRSVPYGYEKNPSLSYQNDNRFTSFSNEYKILRNQNYEKILQRFSGYEQIFDSPYALCREENKEIFQSLPSENNADMQELLFPAIPGVFSYSPETVEAMILCENGYRDFVYKHHTKLPDTDAMQRIYNTYSYIIDSYDAEYATASDTLEFMQALRETVSKQSTYTLAPGKTPVDQDFAAHFLLDNQKGYCMHYATAGVVLARMAGIPARYCEGYLVDCKENKTLKKTVVNGKSVYTLNVLDSNAHAWVEFYINGWGWVPFEFTYTQVEPQEPSTMPSENPTQQAAVTTAATTIASTEVITSTTTTTVSTTAPTPSQKNRIDLRPLLWGAIILLIIAAIPFSLHLFWQFSEKRRNKSFRQKDKNAAAICIYCYLLRLMKYCGVNTASTKISDISEDGAAKCNHYLGKYRLEDAVSIAAKAKFSHHTITDEELTLLLQITKKLARSIYEENGLFKRMKLRYFMHLC